MATTSHDLTDGAWTELGEGPLYIEAQDTRETRLYFGAAAPALTAEGFHRLTNIKPWFSYGGTAKCFARSERSASAVVTTEGA